MMSAIKMQLGYKCTTLEIPYAFIDHYMTGCAPVYPLIYIYSLRKLKSGEPVTLGDLSAHFQLLDTDVMNAWRHFERAGLIKLEGTAPDISIAFLQVQEPVHEDPEPVTKPAAAPLMPEGRPLYTIQELNLYRSQSKDIERLFSKAEQALGKLLTYHDMNTIFGFYDWLRLPIDVIEYLFCYCEEHGHRSMRYIEKCALDWSDRDIDDLEKALTYVHTFDKNYRAILSRMGKYSSFPTPAQRKLMDKWLHEMNMPLDVILEACDRTSLTADKPTLAYADKIIAKWHKAGITTAADIKQSDDAFAHKKEESIVIQQAQHKPKNNRFINFDQRENDYSQIEKLERQHLLQRVRG